MDIERLLTARVRGIDASGIRRVFDLGAKLKDPINLSIGQPDFAVPREIREAAIEAIEGGQNGYTVTQGIPALRARIAERLREDVGWAVEGVQRAECIVHSGGNTARSAVPPGVHSGGNTARSAVPPGEHSGGNTARSAVPLGVHSGGNTARSAVPPGLIVTSGTSGALWLAMMSVVGEGDEVIFGDPYFVLYPHLVRMMGGTPVLCDTYPDFRMTAERVERLMTPRTKVVLVNSPGNPTGAVLTGRECGELLELCRSRGVLLISDEIYDEFTYSEAREAVGNAQCTMHNAQWGRGDIGGRSRDGTEWRCPSPARFDGASEDVLLVRGFGKTYGVTGWRLGYAAGPRRLIEEMAKLQQYTFVCAPSALQHGAAAALDVDMSEYVAAYQRRRDMVVERLEKVTEVARPGGAFYAFVKVPERLGLTGSAFVEKCIEKSVLVIPGSVFSARDTHFRLSYATEERVLEKGLGVLAGLMGG